MSWFESAYRSGHVPWDPGEYDGHLPHILFKYRIAPGRVLDVGCGTGNSLIWLAKQGFTAVGIDSARAAIEQAREAARRAGIAVTFVEGSFPEGADRLVAGMGSPGNAGRSAAAEDSRADGGRDGGAFGSRPSDRGADEARRPEVDPGAAARLDDGLGDTTTRPRFDLVMERATLQHLGRDKHVEQAIAALADLLVPGGIFYSLTIAGDGAPRSWGLGRWNDRQMRAFMDPHFDILEIERTVFTPGERGSMAAWRSVGRKPAGP